VSPHRPSVRPLAAAALVAGLLAAPAAAHAQGAAPSPSCTGQGAATDACQKAADLFAFLAPQIGASIAGGNATLGQGGALGGLGRFALTVRATGLRGELPNLDEIDVAEGNARSDQFGIDEQWFGLPQVDLALGLFGGIPLGLTSVGGVDLLLSGAWVPEVEEDDFTLGAPDGQFKLGYGARLGIVEETYAMPGVSVSYMRRELPTIDVVARPDDDTLSVSGARVRVDSWRLVAGKRFMALGLAAGVGQDRYDSQASVTAIVNDEGVRTAMGTAAPFAQELTRTNAFANLSLNLFVLRLVGEIGRTWGGDAETFNTFEGTSATEPRVYGSVGLRFGF